MIMRTNTIFVLLSLVKLNNKIAYVNIIEIEKIATYENIIGMFPKKLITIHARSSLLNLKTWSVWVSQVPPHIEMQ